MLFPSFSTLIIIFQKERIRESSFIMTKGGIKILTGGSKNLGGALKKLGGAPKFVYFKPKRRGGS